MDHVSETNTKIKNYLHIDKAVRGFVSKLLEKFFLDLNNFRSAAYQTYACSTLFFWKNGEKTL